VDVHLAHLRALRAVARHASFSRAAGELHLTQPAVSMQIRQLESAVGQPLLERVGKRAFPTRAGELLLARAERMLAELEAGLAEVQRLRGIVAGRVRLGTSASISIHLLPPVFRRFRAAYPQTELVVVTGNAPELAQAVLTTALDVALITLPVRPPGLAVTPYQDDELVAIAAPDAAPRRGRLTAAELAAHPLILYEHGSTVRRVIDDWFRRGGATPGAPMDLGSTEAIKKLVEAGLGMSIASRFSVQEEVRRGRLVARSLEPPLVRRIGIVRRRDRPPTPALEAFLATLGARRGRATSRR
jgi:DNA-binding transcriptional LysR family regulator